MISLLVVKKKFKLIDDLAEEAFLNKLNVDGYLLNSYDGQQYQFTKTEKQYYYLIEFFFKKLSEQKIKDYEDLGYKLILKYDSKAKGYYYYFVSKHTIKDIDRSLVDRYKNLLNSKIRVDRFTSVIFVSVFGLFSFLYFKSQSEVYIFILLLVVLLGGYFGHIYLETIKRLSEYTKILESQDRILNQQYNQNE